MIFLSWLTKHQTYLIDYHLTKTTEHVGNKNRVSFTLYPFNNVNIYIYIYIYIIYIEGVRWSPPIEDKGRPTRQPPSEEYCESGRGEPPENKGYMNNTSYKKHRPHPRPRSFVYTYANIRRIL